jgi:hypothetical protein
MKTSKSTTFKDWELQHLHADTVMITLGGYYCFISKDGRSLFASTKYLTTFYDAKAERREKEKVRWKKINFHEYELNRPCWIDARTEWCYRDVLSKRPMDLGELPGGKARGIYFPGLKLSATSHKYVFFIVEDNEVIRKIIYSYDFAEGIRLIGNEPECVTEYRGKFHCC